VLKHVCPWWSTTVEDHVVLGNLSPFGQKLERPSSGVVRNAG
jgi:hypothetical protein